MTSTRPTVVAALSLLLITSYAAVLPSAQAATLNRPPDAQAGPSPHVVDGGSNDADGSDDGTVAITLDGTRSTDPDNELNNDITCKDLLTTFNDEELTYRWYRGHGNISDKDPIAYGEMPTFDLDYGLHNFTLEVEDKCEQTDTDIVRAFALNSSATTDKTWTFDDGAPEALQETEEYWRVTGECDVAADGQYLAFNRPDVCDYDTSTDIQGNATLTYDVGDWFVTGISFDTLWDTRDDYIDGIQDHMTVQASLDHGHTWTDANLTFNYTQGDYESNTTWVSGSGIFNLKESVYKSGNISIRFKFDSGSDVDSGDLGWLVDNVTVLGLRDSMYTTTWNGTEYEVSGDPIQRAGLKDPDGDGFADLDPVNITSGVPSNASLEDISNQDIINATERLNLTDSEIKEIINTTLDWNSTYDDERSAAFDLIVEDDYKEAREELIGTPAQLVYYCGKAGEVPSRMPWVFGIPAPLNCDSDAQPDITLNATVGGVNPCLASDSNIDYISYDTTMAGRGFSIDPEILWGMKYEGIGGFVDGDTQDNYAEASAQYDDLCGNTARGEVTVDFDDSLNPGDKLALFKGEPRGDYTLEAVLDSSTDWTGFDWRAAKVDGITEIGFDSMDSIFPNAKKVRFDLQMSDQRTVEGYFCSEGSNGACNGVPSIEDITFSYQELVKGSGLTGPYEGGIAQEVELYERGDDNLDAWRQATWHWTLYNGSDPEVTLDFEEMPQHTTMRLDDGNTQDKREIASLDFSRPDAQFGRFGTIALDASTQVQTGEFNLSMRGNDIRRLRFAGGPDPTESDHRFTELTVNLPPRDETEGRIEGDLSGSSEGFEMRAWHTISTDDSDYNYRAIAQGDLTSDAKGVGTDGYVEDLEVPRADYNQYVLDTVLESNGDYLSGLEFDEIASTGDYPCAVFLDLEGICS